VHNAKRGDAYDLYKGWLSVERSMYGQIDSYVTERLRVFSGGWIEIRSYRWSQPIEVIWSTERRCYLLAMSLAGHETATVVTDLKTGQEREFKSGAKMILVPPQQRLRCNSQEGQVRSLRCVLDARLVESLLNAIPMWDWGSVSLHRTHNTGGGRIEWLLRQMYREMIEPDFGTGPAIEALAKQLSVEILRKFRPRSAERIGFTGGLSPRYKRLIRERLAAREPLPNREELASLCGMTIRHLSRAFRTETGQTLGRYIDSIMVEKAIELLRADVSVREVSASLGYSTAGSFTTAFRRATGMLPREVKTITERRSNGGPGAALFEGDATEEDCTK
jgi:AraC family transcriptional regulator